MKRALPKEVTFLSVYLSKEHGYCVRAVVNKKEYLFTIDEYEYLTPDGIEHLKSLIKAKL
jgi:hypothetical protein